MSEHFIAKAHAIPKSIDCLDVAEFWQSHDHYIIQAERVENNSFFYPLYCWNDLYSFSPLALMIHKGNFNLNHAAVADLRNSKNSFSRPSLFIDSDIKRLGAPPVLNRKIRDRNQFIQQMAKAMQHDIDVVESKNPGKTNVLLCGGRDSLNLLLLKWTNPIVVYSAAPNTPLVTKFVRQNGLDIDVHELLLEEDSHLLPREIAEAATMVGLEGWKWTPHLLRISDTLGKEAVFWKGQFADAFLTDFWRSYSHASSPITQISKKIHRRVARMTPTVLNLPLDHFSLKHFSTTIWERGAVLQGAHMGFLRSITDCLWVSGYHGPQTAAVWTAGDLPYLTQSDLRPEIGETLLGRPVVYPNENPSPPYLEARKSLRDIEHFKKALERFSISVLD